MEKKLAEKSVLNAQGKGAGKMGGGWGTEVGTHLLWG